MARADNQDLGYAPYVAKIPPQNKKAHASDNYFLNKGVKMLKQCVWLSASVL